MLDKIVRWQHLWIVPWVIALAFTMGYVHYYPEDAAPAFGALFVSFIGFYKGFRKK
jgi:hypothetical protein